MAGDFGRGGGGAGCKGVAIKISKPGHTLHTRAYSPFSRPLS